VTELERMDLGELGYWLNAVEQYLGASADGGKSDTRRERNEIE
jgi:hypothetical protein